MSQTKAQLIDTLVASLLPASDSSVDIGSNGVRFANIYGDTLYGDGSNLTGITSTTINNNADNRLITGSGSANTLNGESGLTFNGSNFEVTATSGAIKINSTGPSVHFIDTNANSDFMAQADGGVFKIVDLTNSDATRLVLDSSGNVGINNTNPDRKLEVQNDGDYAAKFSGGSGAGHTSIEIGQVATNGSAGFNATGGSMLFDIAGSEKMRLNTSGNLGIGISSPNNPLHVHQSGSGATVIQVTNADTGSGATDGLQFGVNSSEQAFFHMREAAPILFTINGSERMRIDSSGRVGIGQSTNLGNYSSDADRLVVGAGNPQEGITILSGQSVGHHGSIYFGDGTGSTNSKRGQIRYEQNTEAMSFATAGTEKLRIDISGRFLLGTTASRTIAGHSPRFLLNGDDYNQATLQITSNQGGTSGGFIQISHQRSGSAGGNTILQDGDDFGRIRFTGGDGTNIDSRGAEIIAQVDGTPGVDDMPGRLVFMTTADGNQSTTERLRITSGGMLEMRSDMSAADQATRNIFRFTDTDTSTTSNQSMGRLQWFSSDASGGGACVKAEIEAVANDSTPEANLLFKTHTSSNTSPTERMRITGDGHVGIGTSSPRKKLDLIGPDGASGASSGNSDTALLIDNNGGNGAIIEMLADNNAYGRIFFTDTDASNQGQIVYHHSSDELAFSANATEVMRLKAGNDGSNDFKRVLIGTTVETFAMVCLKVHAGNFQPLSINDSSNTSSFTSRIGFRTGNNQVGTIKSSSSATQYNTSSDYRLKENAVAISDGITRLKTLKPYRFNWISDETNTPVDGFFAHEVSGAVPEAISGTKDKVADAADVARGDAIKVGDPVYQEIDQSKLVPLLVAAVQELTARVETLEAA